jgi:hypothetical protein
VDFGRIPARLLLILIVLIMSHLTTLFFGSRIVGRKDDLAQVKINGNSDAHSQVFHTAFHEVIVKGRFFFYLIRPTLSRDKVFLLSNQYTQMFSLLFVSGFENELQMVEEGPEN